MSEHITASPLTWPEGWPRSKTQQSSRFGKWNKPVTIRKAVDLITDQLGMMNVPSWNIIISTDLELRNDGLPYSNQKEPADKGASVWWRKANEGEDERKVIALDHYDRIADNLYAIGKTVEAMRGIDRWGGGAILNRTFTGFTALPPPDADNQPSWRVVLEYSGHDLNEANQIYKRLRKRYHPDTGGSAKEFHILNKAWQQAEKELKY